MKKIELTFMDNTKKYIFGFEVYNYYAKSIIWKKIIFIFLIKF